MNASQIHLAFTHVPVILSFVGLIILVISFFKPNVTLSRTAFFIFLFAGLFTIPVYLSGEGAEEIVEKMPGVSDDIIERHEETANIALIIIAATGFISLITLFVKSLNPARILKVVTLIIALASAAVMAQTAHLGGQIRHTEVRPGFLAGSNANEESGSDEKGSKSVDQSSGNKSEDDND